MEEKNSDMSNLELVENGEENWVYSMVQNIKHKSQQIQNFVRNTINHQDCPRYNVFLLKVKQDREELLRSHAKEIIDILLTISPYTDYYEYEWGISWINNNLHDRSGQRILLEILQQISTEDKRFSRDCDDYLENNTRLRQIYRRILFPDAI